MPETIHETENSIDDLRVQIGKSATELGTLALQHLVINDGYRPPLESSHLNVLTSREYEVINLMSTGLTNSEIGKKVYLAEQSIKSHLTQIYRKLGVSNRVEATSLVPLNETDEIRFANFPRRLEWLTPRERDVLREIVSGKTDKKASIDLKVAEATVTFHLKNILRTLNLSNRIELTRFHMWHLENERYDEKTFTEAAKSLVVDGIVLRTVAGQSLARRNEKGAKL